jgi:hypothetical protein
MILIYLMYGWINPWLCTHLVGVAVLAEFLLELGVQLVLAQH